MNTIVALLEAVHEFVAGHGAMLLAGSTALLAAGTLAGRLQRSPIHRQRLGEFTVGCTLLWVVLACVPLPRLAPVTGGPRNRPFPARPLTLPPAPYDPGLYVAAYPAAPNDGELAELLSTLTQPQAGGQFDSNLAGNFPATAVPGLTVGMVLATLYLAGAFVCAAWLLLGNVLLARMIRTAHAPPGWLQDLFLSLHRQTSVGRPPRLLVSDQCARPVSCGVFRPTVLLPLECARHENVAQLRHVLLHELGHVRQRDAVGNALFNLAMPLLFFHPLYWLVRADVHLARELVADDWAAARTGKSSYVQELIALARSRLPSGAGGACAGGRLASIGLFLFGTGSPTNFYRRMHMLMHRRDSLATRCSAAWRVASFTACAFVLAAAVSVGGVQPVRAQDGPSASDDAKRAEADRARAEQEKLRAMLEANEQELRRARELLEKAQYDAKRVQDQKDKRQVEVKAAQSQLDAMKKQLADSQQQIAEAHKQAAADKGKVEKEMAQKMKEMAKQQAQIAQQQAKLQARAMELSRKQQPGLDARAKEELLRKWNDTAKHSDGLDDDERDQAMMRRLYLDIVGRTPSGEELDDFKKDGRSDKREQLVEKLLAERPDAALDKALAKSFKDFPASQENYKRGGSQKPDPLGGGAGLNLDVGSLDLVGLATSYADAVGDVRVAEVRVKVAQEKNSPSDQMLEQVAMEKSRHKARLLRSIAEIALRGAHEELQRTEQLAKQGLAPQSTLAESKAKVQILEVILDTNTGGATPQRR